MSNVSLERYYFVLSDGALTSEMSKRALIAFCDKTIPSYLRHLFPVRLRVYLHLGEQYRVLFGRDAELVVEGMVPDLLHVVPAGHDAVLDGVAEGQDTAFALRFVSDVGILLAHADHDALVAGTAHDGGEDGPGKLDLVKRRLTFSDSLPGGVISGEASLAHAGAVVHNERCHFGVHLELREVVVVR